MAVDLPAATAQLAVFHATGGVTAGRGLEAIIAGATLAVSKRTWLLPGRREIGAGLLRGASADALHRARPYRVVPPGASPAARLGQAVGLGMAGESALCFVGTGSVGYGLLAEVLPNVTPGVQVVVSWYDRPGPFAAPLNPATLALAAGRTAVEVDGTDPQAVFDAVQSGAFLTLARI